MSREEGGFTKLFLLFSKKKKILVGHPKIRPKMQKRSFQKEKVSMQFTSCFFGGGEGGGETLLFRKQRTLHTFFFHATWCKHHRCCLHACVGVHLSRLQAGCCIVVSLGFFFTSKSGEMTSCQKKKPYSGWCLPLPSLPPTLPPILDDGMGRFHSLAVSPKGGRKRKTFSPPLSHFFFILHRQQNSSS